MWLPLIQVHWQQLVNGGRVHAPAWLDSPGNYGFKRLGIALPQGQSADWAMSCSDGSRIHIHEFLDGRRVIHRDKHDPDKDLGSMIAHLLTETPVGGVAVVAGLCAVIINANG
jgi:hypothetical protein